MSRTARRWERSQVNRYGAAIPRVRGRVRRQSIQPVQLGPAASRHTGNARQRYELHEGIADLTQQTLETRRQATEDANLRAAQAQARSAHPGMSLQQTQSQFANLMDYVALAELVGDRLNRSQHAQDIRQLLQANERLLQSLDSVALSDASVPSIRELRAVIISQETAARALGNQARASARPGVQPWRMRPWIWESRFWDGDYNREQILARQRRDAWNATRIRIPQPYLVSGNANIMRVAATLGCAIISAR